MKNATGSKSAPKSKTPKAKTEVTPVLAIDPNPATSADAPPTPPKPAGRKRKVEPTVATKTEMPEWAQNAAARDTAAEMAAVPEPAPVVGPAPKKRRANKAPKVAAAKTDAPGSLRAIGERWLDALRAAGHTPSTVSSYGNDLEIAYEHIGADAVAAEITEKQIAGFNASKGVMKTRTGKPKAQPTILKTRRALRIALVWAADQKLIAKAPFSAA